MMWILCTVAIALAAQEPMLMPRAPEWQVEVTGTYENGLPREVQFYNDETKPP